MNKLFLLSLLLAGHVGHAAPSRDDLISALPNTSDAALCYVNLVMPQWGDIVTPEIRRRSVRCNMDRLAEGGLEALQVHQWQQSQKDRGTLMAFLEQLKKDAEKSQLPAW